MDLNEIKSIDIQSDFSVPIYVSSELQSDPSNGNERINLSDAYQGVLTHRNRNTILEINTLLLNTLGNTESQGIAETDTDIGTLYGATWDNKIQFTFRTFMNTKSTFNFDNIMNRGGNQTTLEVFDYSVSKYANVANEIQYLRVELTNLEDWVNFEPVFDENDVQSKVYNGLSYGEIEFSLSLERHIEIKTQSHVQTRSAKVYAILNYQNKISREEAMDTIDKTLQFFQFMCDVPINVNKIHNFNSNGFIDVWMPAFSFEEVAESGGKRAPILFKSICNELGNLFQVYLDSSDIQMLLASYHLARNRQIPVSTMVMTMVSSIETYYRNEKYGDGTQVKKAKEKLKRFFKKDNHLIEQYFSGNITELDNLVDEIVDSRNYYVHGDTKTSVDYFESIQYVEKVIFFRKILREALFKHLKLLTT